EIERARSPAGRARSPQITFNRLQEIVEFDRRQGRINLGGGIQERASGAVSHRGRAMVPADGDDRATRHSPQSIERYVERLADRPEIASQGYIAMGHRVEEWAFAGIESPNSILTARSATRQSVGSVRRPARDYDPNPTAWKAVWLLLHIPPVPCPTDA